MASTIDSISGGFGVNLVTGWQKPEYDQMGIWPGTTISPAAMTISPNTFRCCATCGAPGAAISRRLLHHERLPRQPAPSQPMKVICAGQSDAGMAFSAQHADYNFCFGKGVNTPTAFAPTAARMMQAAEKPAATWAPMCCLW
jgi:pyrimidine oxygenase